MPATVDGVKAWLKMGDADAADDALIESAVDATNAWVATTPYVVALTTTNPPPDPPVWPDDVDLGATMLAARLYRRRNSPAGLEAIDGGVVYTDRRDYDVDRLLHLGRWSPVDARIG